MKWLATVLCVLAVSASALGLPIEPNTDDTKPSEPEQRMLENQVVTLPVTMQCTLVPADELLKENYNEIGFLEADASIFNAKGTPVPGKLKMYMSTTTPRTFTIMFEFNSDLYCMVMSGENAVPMSKGDGI